MINCVQRPFGRMFAFGLAIITALSFIGAPTGVAAQNAAVSKTTGSGTYVCTPAGFGSKSRCYRR